MIDLRFPPTSRYYGIETARFVGPDGVEHVYLKRRFVPPPERFALLLEHLVRPGERLDNITASGPCASRTWRNAVRMSAAR